MMTTIMNFLMPPRQVLLLMNNLILSWGDERNIFGLFDRKGHGGGELRHGGKFSGELKFLFRQGWDYFDLTGTARIIFLK